MAQRLGKLTVRFTDTTDVEIGLMHLGVPLPPKYRIVTLLLTEDQIDDLALCDRENWEVMALEVVDDEGCDDDPVAGPDDYDDDIPF